MSLHACFVYRYSGKTTNRLAQNRRGDWIPVLGSVCRSRLGWCRSFCIMSEADWYCSDTLKQSSEVRIATTSDISFIFCRYGESKSNRSDPKTTRQCKATKLLMTYLYVFLQNEETIAVCPVLKILKFPTQNPTCNESNSPSLAVLRTVQPKLLRPRQAPGSSAGITALRRSVRCENERNLQQNTWNLYKYSELFFYFKVLFKTCSYLLLVYTFLYLI